MWHRRILEPLGRAAPTGWEYKMPANILLRRAVLAATFTGTLAMFPAVAQQETGTWTKVTSLPQARDEEQAAAINGKIYLVGGAWDDVKDGKRDERYADGFMTEYDPQTNTFRERSHGPEGLTHQGIAVVNGKIYLVGGFAGGHHTLPSAGVYSYDPATDKWQHWRLCHRPWAVFRSSQPAE
jgi:N-acetylneuraminic acid mutarotase